MNYTTLLRFLLVITLFQLGTPVLRAQDSSANLSRKLDAWRSSVLQEKVYAHLDRTFYLTGETVWFKLYYTDAGFNLPLDISKVAYVEILNLENKPVAQIKIGIAKGGGNGSVFLPASLTSGNYIFRAYTSWMKNFSPDLFYTQAITIVNPFIKLGLTEKKEAPKFDAQFLPEGGDLVAGLPGRIGFRVSNATGKGIDYHGVVLTENNDTVAHFKPHRFGIGSFSFTPREEHSYTAVVYHEGHVIARVALPAVRKEGYVLRITDTTDQRIKISIRSVTPSQTGTPYCYLLVHTRETAIQSKMIFLDGGRGMYLLDKDKVGEGISHFTVFDPAQMPVCERLYFKQPKKLDLLIKPDQNVYEKRHKVTLDLSAQSGNSPSQAAHLSFAVCKLDSLQMEEPVDIRTYLLLTSELKGAIESPASYFHDVNEEDHQAIDNLMMTHGWSRFRWKDVMKKSASPEFIPEYRGHIITGQVKGLTAIEGRKVIAYLSNPDRNVRLYPSRSTSDGRIQFELRQFYGSRKLILQTNTRLDSIYDVELFSPFSKSISAYQYPEFGFTPQLAHALVERSLYMQVQNTFHELKNDRFTVHRYDTTAFYGQADEKYFLDDYTRFPTMEEVMREYITGVRVRNRKGNFHFGVMDNVNKSLFRDDPLVMLDGVPVFNNNKIIALDPLKVKKIEVMTRRYYLGPLAFDGIVSFTTYHGDMADFEMDKRALILDYEGLQQYREFFSPVYETPQEISNRVPDARTILYWNPGLTTDTAGSGKCSFYTSDMAGTYKVIAQGLSADGIPGSTSVIFSVK